MPLLSCFPIPMNCQLITFFNAISELEEHTDGRVRLILTLSKLNQVTKLDFLLDADEARALAAALTK